MATFIKSKDDRLINLYYVQNIVINPENDKEIIIYNKNGESIIESYDTVEEANTAYDNYVTKMEESSGGGGGAKLQTKSVTITENGTNTILPDENYDGMNKVNLTVDVAGSEYNVKMNVVFTSGNHSILGNITEISAPDISNTTSLDSMFENLKGIATIPQLDTSKVKNMQNMFRYCNSLISIPLLDTSEVTNMSGMFYSCSSLTEIPLLDTSEVTNMSSMFNGCNALTTIPQLNTSKVTNMNNMFSYANNLTSLPVLNTSKVTTMQNMFSSTSNITNTNVLNNVLQMCINATLVSTKTLKYLGLSSAQAIICQSLSNYQAFLDAGWTTGY